MTEQFNLLLADDDTDDQLFFDDALKIVSNASHLNIVEDGEELMRYLISNAAHLPDMVFLDVNMPRKNGTECLNEIKSNKALKDLPIIIYSTSMTESLADSLYNSGAHYFFQKATIADLKTNLHSVLTMMKTQKFIRPERNNFILKAARALST